MQDVVALRQRAQLRGQVEDVVVRVILRRRKGMGARYGTTTLSSSVIVWSRKVVPKRVNVLLVMLRTVAGFLGPAVALERPRKMGGDWNRSSMAC